MDIPSKIALNATWTPDCCGKQDYDAPILSISTRYWPRGGGLMVVYNLPSQPIKIEMDSERQEIKPSANCSLKIDYAEDTGLDFVLAEKDFEGETEEEVKAQVEIWAQQQMDKAVAALVKAFCPSCGGNGDSGDETGRPCVECK